MNIWKIASRWSAHGASTSSILDIFIKNNIAFIYPNGSDLSRIQVGDLIAISDGHEIVAVGQATSKADKVSKHGIHLSEVDKKRIDWCQDEAEGVRIQLPQSAIFEGGKSIPFARQGRFCQIKDPTVTKNIREAWEAAESQEQQDDFNIEAESRTFKELLNDQETRLYVIPIFQRPYAWGETELERFLTDLISSYKEGKRMFIGTMQLSGKRWLSPRGDFFREVIDGQQRLTTVALILKAMTALEPENASLRELCRGFNWLENKVNSGQQQERLDEVLHSENLDATVEKGVNRYFDNCRYIKDFLIETLSDNPDENAGNEPTKKVTVSELFNHLVEKLLFVVIKTQAGLSQTIEIFNVINTTGLDLNGGDLFKVRAYEYLTACKGKTSDCFDEISRLYETIDKNVATLNKAYVDFNGILWIYQRFMVARYEMGREAVKLAAPTFYERLFDSLLNLKKWDHFNRIRETEPPPPEPIINLNEIDKLIQIRHRYEVRWSGNEPIQFDFNTRLAFLIIGRSLYHQYWWLYLAVELRYPEATDKKKCDFIRTIARLFVVFSSINRKQVNQIHAFIFRLTERMFKKDKDSLEQLTRDIQKKTNEYQESFLGALKGHLAHNGVAKHLICRLLETLAQKEQLNRVEQDKLNNIFAQPYDIEHIQSYHDLDPSLREETWEEWGELINSVGNLMLLEHGLNRSIQNKLFTDKKSKYKESELFIPKDIGKKTEWIKKSAEDKLKKDTERLEEFLFKPLRS